MRPWRYHDEERKLDEQLLEDFKLAATEPELTPEPVEEDAIRRTVEGDTACQDVEDIKTAARAMAPELIADHAMRDALLTKLTEKYTALDAFINTNNVIKES